MPSPEPTRAEPVPARRYRFGVFEADVATGELRRQGLRVRIHAQPFQLLVLLLDHPGDLISRDDIAARLWPSDTFVDYEHGVNSAVNRIREALGDTAGNPRFIETLARRGYRFIAPVERIENETRPERAVEPRNQFNVATSSELQAFSRILATPEDLPETPRPVAHTLFILFQVMYLAFYLGALTNLGEIEELIKPLAYAGTVFYVLIASAAILIPVRAFTLCAVLFRAPHFCAQFLKIWPLLLFFDVLWALSPFLLLHHISYGLAIGCMALLVYSPFAQRSILLMGFGKEPSVD